MASTDGGSLIRSGLDDLDEILGGFFVGDNVVWLTNDLDLCTRVEQLLLEGTPPQQTSVYVTASSKPSEIRRRFGPALRVLDARPGSADPKQLEEAIVAAVTEQPTRVVIDGMESFAQRWGVEQATSFFRRVCPRLFDLGSIAYWRVPRRFRPGAIDEIRKVTQCVLELSEKHLRIIKAEGHPATVQGRLFRVSRDGPTIHLRAERAQGRLAEGIQRMRSDRNLSQADLARLADVSPSAISQAEAGQRGLSLDTLLTLTGALGVGLDDLLENQQRPDYVLARRDRGVELGASRFLLDDPAAGLRVYLSNLRPGEKETPPVKHKGTESVLVARGLVLVDLGSSSPAMRAGDAILASRVPILSWQNLSPHRSVLFWILRD